MKQGAGPSSPPETPTHMSFSARMARRNGLPITVAMPIPGARVMHQPNHFSYNPNIPPPGFSPQSPSSTHLTRSPSISPRSSRSEFDNSYNEPLPSPPVRRRFVLEGNFTVEELNEDEYEDVDSDDEDMIIRPHQYEDAESESGFSMKKGEIDPHLVAGMHQMVFDEDDAARDAWVQQMREQKKIKRRTSSTLTKRKIGESIGSSDEEDLQPCHLSAHEAGSSERRLKRKVGSLIFEDPPPGIPELEEPESCEELIEDDQPGDVQGVDRHLPFYVQVMDVDTDDED